MLSIDRIYCGGEAGQFRARDDTFGWKSAAGPRDAQRSAASVLKAEWFEGTLKILCRTEDAGGTEVLTLDGFASKDYDGLFRYFRESCNDVYIKKHRPVVSIDEDDFDRAMRHVEDAADLVDECQPGSVAKKAREADLMEKVGGLRNGLERAVGGDKQALGRVFSANGCERIGRLHLVIRTVQLEVYLGDPRWAHLRDTAKTIKSVLRELGTFRRWVPPNDGGHESQARRQMVWELKAKQRGSPDGAGNDDNDDEDDFGDDSGNAPRSRPGGEGAPRVGRIDAAAVGHIDVTKLGPAGVAPPAVPATQRGTADGDSSPAGAATDARGAAPGAAPPARGALTAPPRNRSTSDGAPQGVDASGRDLRWCHVGSLCEGWVWKRSRFLRQWRRRWFVLMPQRLDSCRQRGGVATETIHAGSTQQYTLYNADDELMMRNTFCIAGVRRYYVSCDSPEEKQRWVQEIAQVLAPSRRRS